MNQTRLRPRSLLSPKLTKLSRLSLACAAVLLAQEKSRAAATVYTLPASSFDPWEEAAWLKAGDSLSAFPNAAGDTAQYAGGSAAVTEIDNPITVGELFQNGAGLWRITSGLAGSLIFDNTGGTGSARLHLGGAGGLQLEADVTVTSGGLTISSDAGATGLITVSGAIGGTGDLTLTGARAAEVMNLANVNNVGALNVAVSASGATGTIFTVQSLGSNVTGVTVGDAANPTFGGTLNLTGTSTFNGPILIQGAATLKATTAGLGGEAATGAITFGATGGSLTGTGGLTTARAIVLNGTGNVPIASGDTVTLNGAISGSGGLSKSGLGGLIIGGTESNTFTGALTVAGGSIPGNGDFVGQVSLQKTGGAIAVSGPLVIDATQTGASIGIGTAANTRNQYGQQFGPDTVLSFSHTTSGLHGYFNLYGTDQTLAGLDEPVSLGGIVQNSQYETISVDSVLTINNTSDYTFAGYLRNTSGTQGTGTISIVKTGSGTQTLSGIQITYTGSTTINQGTLSLIGTTNFNSSLVNFGTGSTGRLLLGSTTQSIRALASDESTSGGVVENGVTTGTTVLTINQTTDTSFGGLLKDNAGGGTLAVIKTGSGTLTLTNANTFTGGLTLTGGAVATDNNDNLGSFSTPLTFSGGVLRVLGTDFTGLFGRTIADPVVNQAVSLDIADAGNEFTLYQSIAGAGGLSKSGAGILLLTSANTYTGVTNITGGILRAGIENAIAGTISLTFGTAGAATFQLNGFNQTIGTASNSGINTANPDAIIENGSAIPSTLTVLNGNTATYAGTIRDGGIAPLSFTRGGGASTLTLSGTNTYTGVTTLNTGVTSVTVLGNGGTPSGIGATSSVASNLILNGGLLGYSGSTAASTNRQFTLGANGGGLDASGTTPAATVAFTSTAPITLAAAPGARTFILGGSNTGNNTFAGQIIDGTGATNLLKQGAGTWVLTNTSNTYSGTTTVNGGRLVVSQDITGAGVAVASGGTLALQGSGRTLGAVASTSGVTLGGTLDLADGATSTTNLLATSATTALTIGGTVGNPGTLHLEIGPGGSADLISIPVAKLAVGAGGGRIDLTGLAGYGSGTYDLLSFASGQATGLGSLYVGNTPDAAHSWSLVSSATGVQLVASDVFTSTAWTNSGSSTWQTAGNWDGGTVPNGTGTTATFAKVNSGTTTVTLSSANATVGTVNLDSTSAYTIAASGGGILVLNNNGATAAINITAGAHTISAPVALVDSANVNVGGTSLNLSGVISGGGTLVKSGDGTLTLGGTNTFTGGVAITGGVVQYSNELNLGPVPAVTTPNAIVLDGGTLRNTAGVGMSATRGIQLGPNGGTIAAGSGNLNYSGVISELSTPALLTVGAGGGIYVPGGQSTYSGGTKIVAGAFAVPSSSSTGSVGALVSGPFGTGTIELAGGSIRATTGSTTAITLRNAVTITANSLIPSGTTDHDLIFAGPITLVGGTRTLTVETKPTTGYIGTQFAGSIGDEGNGYGFILAGSGTSILAGSNTFTGGLTVQSGTVTATNAGALSTGTVTLGNTSGSLDATLLAGIATTFTNPLAVQAGSTGTIKLGNSGANAVVFSGAVALGNALTLTSASTGSITLSGAITGSSALTITGSSGNFVLLSGNNASYTGNVTVSSGTLRLGSATSLGANNAVTLAASTTFDLNNLAITLRSIAGAGNVTQNGAAARILTFGDATDTTFSGNFTASTPANLAVTKNGTGTLTLSGKSTYTGATVVNGGTLLLDFATNNTGVLSNTTALTLGNATLSLKGRTGAFTSTQTLGNLTLTAGTSNAIVFNPNGGTSTTLTLGNTWTRGAGATLFIDRSATGTSTLTSSPALTNGIIGSWAVVKDQTGTGFATVSGGNVVRLASGTALTSTSNVSTTNFTSAPTDAAYTDGTLTLAAGTHATNSLSIDTSSGTGTLDVTGTSITFTSGGLLMNGSNDYLIQGGTVGASAAELIVQQYGTGTLTISSAISGGAGSLTKAGSGVLVLSGAAKTYTGATTVQAGTLRAGAANSFSASSAVTLANVAGATLDLNGFSQTIGSLAGGGVLGGNVTLGSGTLTTGNANATTFAGTISGTGGLTKQGTGIFTLTGANTYSGVTTVNAGVLHIENALALGTTAGGTTVATGASLELAGGITVSGETVTINGVGGNIGALRGSGAGVNTWAGNVVIGSSDARIGATNSGTLIVSGVISGSNPLNARTDSMNSTLVVTNGSNSYTGATNIIVGILKLDGGANRLPVGTTVNLGNNAGQVAARWDLNGWDQTVVGVTSVTGANIPLEVTSAAPATLTLTATSGTQSYVGTYTGALSLTKTGGSTISLGGVSTYTGATTINGGTVLAAVAGAFSSSSAFTLADTAGVTLNLGGFNQTIGSLSGGGTTGGNVTLGAGTLTTGGDNSTTLFAGGISGTGGLTKEGTGSFILTGTATYTGPTAVNGGTLEIGGSLQGTTLITVAEAAKLQLSASQAVNNVTTALTLDSGSTLAVAEGLNTSTQTFGTLTLLGDATIDFGSTTLGLGGNTLSFANLATSGSLLSIVNWTGALGLDANPNTDPNQDRFLFTSEPTLSETDLAAIRFYDDNGSFLGTGAIVSFSGGGYEIIPVPEPSSAILLGLGGLLALGRFRRRVAR